MTCSKTPPGTPASTTPTTTARCPTGRTRRSSRGPTTRPSTARATPSATGAARPASCPGRAPAWTTGPCSGPRSSVRASDSASTPMRIDTRCGPATPRACGPEACSTSTSRCARTAARGSTWPRGRRRSTSSTTTAWATRPMRRKRPSFYDVRVLQLALAPAYRFELSGADVWLGPVVKYADTKDNAATFLAQERPYGSDRFGQVGARAALNIDRRGLEAGRATGAMLSIEGAVYPGVWSVSETFGRIDGEGVAYLTAPLPLEPTLALRAGGAKVFGRYPFHEAASIGGGGSLRGLPRQRYAGDASAYGNLELRLLLVRRDRALVPRLGVFGLADAGRVFLKERALGALAHRVRRRPLAGGGRPQEPGERLARELGRGPAVLPARGVQLLGRAAVPVRLQRGLPPYGTKARWFAASHAVLLARVPARRRAERPRPDDRPALRGLALHASIARLASRWNGRGVRGGRRQRQGGRRQSRRPHAHPDLRDRRVLRQALARRRLRPPALSSGRLRDARRTRLSVDLPEATPGASGSVESTVFEAGLAAGVQLHPRVRLGGSLAWTRLRLDGQRLVAADGGQQEIAASVDADEGQLHATRRPARDPGGRQRPRAAVVRLGVDYQPGLRLVGADDGRGGCRRRSRCGGRRSCRGRRGLALHGPLELRGPGRRHPLRRGRGCAAAQHRRRGRRRLYAAERRRAAIRHRVRRPALVRLRDREAARRAALPLAGHAALRRRRPVAARAFPRQSWRTVATLGASIFAEHFGNALRLDLDSRNVFDGPELSFGIVWRF